MSAGPRTLKITLIGAGSVVFTRKLLGDILSRPELAGCHVALHDIDENRLRLAEGMAQRVADAVGAQPRITASTDRRRAIEGAGYVINTIQVGGYRPATVTDFEIPKRFGLRQTIGDTLGIGGIMRGLRAADCSRDAGHAGRHGGTGSRRAAPELRQPDGDDHLGVERQRDHGEDGGPVPQRAEHG